MSSVASLKAEEPQVQAKEVLSQPMQHEADGEEPETGVFAKQDLAPDSPEATTAGAQADIEEDTHLPIDAMIRMARTIRFRPKAIPEFRRGPSIQEIREDIKEKGSSYALVASMYTESLETRVGVLEKELLDLQYEVGSKERVVKKEKAVEEDDESERQVMRDVCTMIR